MSAVQILKQEHDVTAFWTPVGSELLEGGIQKYFPGIQPGNFGHACEMETAQCMYLRPDIVREKREKGINQTSIFTDRTAFVPGGGQGVWNWKHDVTLNGALGDARKATAEIGYSKLAVCTSPSKTFNMAGLKMANIFIPDEAMRKKFTRRSKSQCGIIPNNPVSITGISAAYAKGDKWLDEVKQYIWENFQFVDAYLKEYMPKLKMTKPEATYLAWIDFSGVGLSGLKLRSFLRGKARVALDEGMVFGKSGENFARINVATDRTVVRECLDRIRDNLAR